MFTLTYDFIYQICREKLIPKNSSLEKLISKWQVSNFYNRLLWKTNVR